MSDLTKKKLFSISNAVKRYAYSFIDENGEWNDKGTKFAGLALAALLFISFYIMGGDI